MGEAYIYNDCFKCNINTPVNFSNMLCNIMNFIQIVLFKNKSQNVSIEMK